MRLLYIEPLFGGVQVKVVLDKQELGNNAPENYGCGCITVQYEPLAVLPVEARRTVTEGESLTLTYPGEIIEELSDPQGILEAVELSENTCTATLTGGAGSGVIFLKMHSGEVSYIRPVKLWIQSAKGAEEKLFKSPGQEFAGPHNWKPINMNALFNAASPDEVLEKVSETIYPMPEEYNQVNRGYYMSHLGVMTRRNPKYRISDERWRSLVDENGIAMTGEGIPFRSEQQGDYMAAVTLAGSAYKDRVCVPVQAAGRAVYLLVTGITFPMQSHVENARVIINYEDGVTQEYPLVNPFDIGDMWSNLWGRFHDTPAAGFENMGGHHGVMSSAGQDLHGPIFTDTEAQILRFPLREGVKVDCIEFRIIAIDVIFALMGITVLE